MIAGRSTTLPASFEDDWAPRDYLWDYYRSVQSDEAATLRFLVESARLIGPVPTLLEVGCGPTVHHALPFAGGVGEIHVADFLDRNLSEVRLWTDGAPGAWDWSPFTREVLRYRALRGRRRPDPLSGRAALPGPPPGRQRRRRRGNHRRTALRILSGHDALSILRLGSLSPRRRATAAPPSPASRFGRTGRASIPRCTSARSRRSLRP